MSTPRTGHDNVQNLTEQQPPPCLFRKGASSCPTSPLQYAKQDRTADYAAVRHLAESYGVDLLPLEMGFTPLKTQAVPKAAQRLSTADSTADHPNTPEVNDSTAAAGARDLEQAFSDANKATMDHPPGTNTANDAQGSLQDLSTGAAAGTAGGDMQGGALQLQEAGSGLSYPIDVDGSGSEVHTDSPSGLAAYEEGSDGYCLYLDEERVPVEERVTQLEEERDTLVDRLLATTAALHESEARYRQTEASNSQVQALLEQLQELLRRAEVERDRAKLQLKRHRVSNSQFMFPASSPDPLAVVRAEPAFVLGPAGEAAVGSALPGLAAGSLARPASKKYKVSAGGSSSAAGTRAASRDLFSRGSSGGKAAAAAAAAAQAPADSAEATPAEDRSSSGEGSTAASATAGPAAAGNSLAAAAAGAGSSVAAVGLGAWGSQRSSQDSSCSSSDAVSPTANLEPVVTLTPSTDEARPPVSSVVRGFEALLHRQRSGKGSSSPGQGSAGGRSRELGVTGRASSGSGSRSASPLASRGREDRPSALAAAPAAEAETEADLPAIAAPMELAAAAAPQAADAAVPASPAAGSADVDGDSAAAGDVPSEDGGSSLSSEAHRRTYADAAVAGVHAERMRHRLGAGQRPRNPARTPGASSSIGSGSGVSTPTAATLCNTPPLGSHMLDSSCFSEEEEESLSSWGGASLSAGGSQHPHSRGASSRGVGVYHPPAQPPGRPASAGGKGGLLPGVKRERSSSPAATPTSVQEQGSVQSGAVSPSISQGSAFGSLFSMEPASPSGSVMQGPASSPGAASTAGNASSSKGKQRPASRLGVTSSPGAAVPVELNPAGVPRSASSSKQEKGPSPSGKQRKGQTEQQGSKACESKSNGGAGTRASGGGSKQKGTVQSTTKPAAAAAVAPKASSPAASTGNKQSSKKAAAAAGQVKGSTDSATGISTRSAVGVRMQPLLVLLVAVLVVALGCGAAVYLWSQSKLTALQAQLQQLQQELTDRSMQCASDLSQPTGPGSHA